MAADRLLDELAISKKRISSTVPSISRVPFRERISSRTCFNRLASCFELLGAAVGVAPVDAPEAISPGVGVLDDDAVTSGISTWLGEGISSSGASGMLLSTFASQSISSPIPGIDSSGVRVDDVEGGTEV